MLPLWFLSYNFDPAFCLAHFQIVCLLLTGILDERAVYALIRRCLKPGLFHACIVKMTQTEKPRIPMASKNGQFLKKQ